MNERLNRLNELRRSKGLKPLKEAVQKAFPEEEIIIEVKSPFEEVLEIKKDKPKKKRKSTKKEIVVETTEAANTDTLFEVEPEPVNKEEVKVEEKPEEEKLLNE